jgi:hypothetical protein
MRRFDQWPDVEFRYMGTDAWSAGASTVTTGALLQMNTQPPTFLPNGRTIAANYRSDLGSFELNLRSDPRGSHIWLLGIRHVELDETFQASMVDTVGPNPIETYRAVTQNRLYGVQVGVETLVATVQERLDIDCVGKIGAYHRVGSHIGTRANPITVGTATGGDENASMLAELHLMGNVHLTDNLSLRGGYGVMWVTNVVLASEQMDNTNFVTSTGINGNGNAFYHGGFLGFDLAY